MQKCLLVCTTFKMSAGMSFFRWQHVKSLITVACISGEIQLDICEMTQCFAYIVTTPWWTGNYNLRLNSTLQDVGVCASRVMAWGVGWTGSAGVAAEQMLGINQSSWRGSSHQVTSRGVPISCELIKTYERKTEAIAADAKVKCI